MNAAAHPNGVPAVVRCGRNQRGATSAAAESPRMCRRMVLTRGAASSEEVPDQSVMMFAYGANLSPASLQKRGVWPLQRALPAVAPADAVLSFCHRGGFATIDFEGQITSTTLVTRHAAGTAQATAAQQPAAVVKPDAEPCSITQPHGMLYSLSATQLTALAKRETGYRLALMPVTPYGAAGTVDAQVFVSQRMLRLRRPLPPTQRYLDLILSGAASWQLSADYIRRLERVPIAQPGGLPGEYFDTPSTGVAAAVVICAALLAASIWLAVHYD